MYNFRGSLLFTGKTSNEVLWEQLQLLGPLPKKTMRAHSLAAGTSVTVSGVKKIWFEVDGDGWFNFIRLHSSSSAQTLAKYAIPKTTSDLSEKLLRILLPTHKGSNTYETQQFCSFIASLLTLRSFNRPTAESAFLSPFLVGT